MSYQKTFDTFTCRATCFTLRTTCVTITEEHHVSYLEQVKQVAQHVWWSVEQQESQLDQLMSQLKED